MTPFLFDFLTIVGLILSVGIFVIDCEFSKLAKLAFILIGSGSIFKLCFFYLSSDLIRLELNYLFNFNIPLDLNILIFIAMSLLGVIYFITYFMSYKIFIIYKYILLLTLIITMNIAILFYHFIKKIDNQVLNLQEISYAELLKDAPQYYLNSYNFKLHQIIYNKLQPYFISNQHVESQRGL